MNNFESLSDVVNFYYKNYHEFLRFDDGTFFHNGTTYKLEFAEFSPEPVLKLSYIDNGTEYVTFAIYEYGICILSSTSEGDTPDVIEYMELIRDFLFDFTLVDLGKINFLFKNFKKHKQL